MEYTCVFRACYLCTVLFFVIQCICMYIWRVVKINHFFVEKGSFISYFWSETTTSFGYCVTQVGFFVLNSLCTIFLSYICRIRVVIFVAERWAIYHIFIYGPLSVILSVVLSYSCRPGIVAERWAILYVFVIKLTKETRRRVCRGRN